ncbi:MAG: hypothetical protein V2J55_13500 [Candidatus Competibacteraceae bacterium]|jgi:predicted flap endonuclease-1-like 5' DNA nuclease|nr:hypothetical protein [Candidatus Competibacteraceae bacterium]
MSQQYHEQILKEWAEMQKRLQESFSTVLPASQAVSDMSWWQNYSQNLSFWENTVKQSLTTEATIMEQWMQQILNQTGETVPSADVTRQMEGVMRHWLRCQAQLMDECFAMLRGGEPNAQPTNEQPDTTEPEAATDPADAWEDSTEPDAEFSEEVEQEQTLPSEQPFAETEEPRAEPVATPYPPDDLKTLAGIGPTIEKKLNEHGIISYRQLAELNEQEVQHLETTVLKFPGRIRRDKWVEQAKEQYLRKYGKLL